MGNTAKSVTLWASSQNSLKSLLHTPYVQCQLTIDSRNASLPETMVKVVALWPIGAHFSNRRFPEITGKDNLSVFLLRESEVP